MVSAAVELAKITSEDPFGGIPEPSQLGGSPLTSIFITTTSTRSRLQIASTMRVVPRRLQLKATANQELRRRFVRRCCRTQSARQFARIRRRVSALLLFGFRGPHSARRERQHAARLLVFRLAHAFEAGIAERSASSADANVAPARRTKGKDHPRYPSFSKAR